MSSLPIRLVTFEEFEALADPSAGHYELQHGQVVYMPPRKESHVLIQQALFQLLFPLTAGKGLLAIEYPFRPATDYEYWQADIAFVAKERRQGSYDYFFGAPDVVIEVRSPSNTKAELLDRQEICLSNGCTSFWVVDPKRRSVHVTGPDRQSVACDSSMSISLPAPLCGVIPVAAIFTDPA